MVKLVMVMMSIVRFWEPVVSFGLRGFKENSKSVGGYDTQTHWNDHNGDKYNNDHVSTCDDDGGDYVGDGDDGDRGGYDTQTHWNNDNGDEYDNDHVSSDNDGGDGVGDGGDDGDRGGYDTQTHSQQ